MSPNLPDDFDYNAVDPEVAAQLRSDASRIKGEMNCVKNSALEVGRILLAAKERIAHGLFRRWVDAEFAFSARSAQIYMNLAELWIDHGRVFDQVTPSALYALAAPKIPVAVRDEVMGAIDRGEARTVKDVKQRIKAAKGIDDALNYLHDEAVSASEVAMLEFSKFLIAYVPSDQVEKICNLVATISDRDFRRLPEELKRDGLRLVELMPA
jgi:hypothetical protein